MEKGSLSAKGKGKRPLTDAEKIVLKGKLAMLKGKKGKGTRNSAEGMGPAEGSKGGTPVASPAHEPKVSPKEPEEKSPMEVEEDKTACVSESRFH